MTYAVLCWWLLELQYQQTSGQWIKVGFKQAFIWDQIVIFFGLLVVLLPISPLRDLQSSFFDGTSLNLQLQKRFNNNSHVQYRPLFGGGGNTYFIYLQPWRSVRRLPFATFPLNSVNVSLFNFHFFNDSRQISSCCLPLSAVWTLTVHSLSHTQALWGFFSYFFPAMPPGIPPPPLQLPPLLPLPLLLLWFCCSRTGLAGLGKQREWGGMEWWEMMCERKLVEVFPGVSSDISVNFPVFGH